ncbi:GM19308 [Drosophila sechellia]|uniref:GM19308 n=1 Tax=Drosophila sechellia TaxID=7238 RepID=B4INT9_DROSE|nr:GM19308 [Drosophila sechellia]
MRALTGLFQASRTEHRVEALGVSPLSLIAVMMADKVVWDEAHMIIITMIDEEYSRVSAGQEPYDSTLSWS